MCFSKRFEHIYLNGRRGPLDRFEIFTTITNARNRTSPKISKISMSLPIYIFLNKIVD